MQWIFKGGDREIYFSLSSNLVNHIVSSVPNICFIYFQLTWADIHIVAQMDYINNMSGKDIFESLPTLSALRGKVNSIPSIKKYLDNRSKSSM